MMVGERLAVHINAGGAVMGGARRHLVPFLEALIDTEPEWDITLWADEGADVRSVPPAVRVHPIPARTALGRVWWISVRSAWAASNEGAEVLVNLTNSGPLRSRLPSVLYQRNSLYFDEEWLRTRSRRFRFEAWLRRRLAFAQMRAACTTIAPSHAMARNLLRWRGLPADVEIEVIAHAVDGERFPNRRRSWPPPASRPLRILSVSHGAPHKGQLLLPDLAAELVRNGQNCEVWITVVRADSPRYVAALEARARDLDVERQVRLLGRVDDVERLYAEADLMVFPSLTESFGFPLAEAMASGLPVVASRIASSEQLLGDHGWYFDPGSVAGAVGAVSELLDAPEQLVGERTSRAAATAKQLTWARNAAAVSAVIRRCVARHPRRRPSA
jgi:glycosyltransferase involved in cell wall biosynthesis